MGYRSLSELIQRDSRQRLRDPIILFSARLRVELRVNRAILELLTDSETPQSLGLHLRIDCENGTFTFIKS